MNIAIVSYSYTGNNDMLASYVAKELKATHIKISTQKPMVMGTIIMDMMFSRTPKVQPSPEVLKSYDLVLFFAPVWMGHVASPLRAYLRYSKSNPQKYGFLSISGGADSENTKLHGELQKRTGTKPVIVLDQHIKDLLTLNSEATRNDTSAYRISEADAKKLSSVAIKEINKLLVHS